MVYVAPTDFAKCAKQLIDSRVQGAIYTKFSPARPLDAVVHGAHDQRIGYDHVDYEERSFAAYIQQKRVEAASVSQKRWYQERINFLNSVERVVVDIVRQFRGYTVTDVHAYHTVRGGHNRGVFNFHADHTGSDQYLTVVATACGPSTVYCKKNEFDEDEIFLPNEALVAHTGAVRHRSPIPEKNSVRLAIVVEMKKKS